SGVHGETDVAGLGESRTAAVDSGPDAALNVVAPGLARQRAMDADRRVDCREHLFEDREELVGAGVDLAATAPPDRLPDDAPNLVQQTPIRIAHPPEQRRGVLDVGEEERHEPGRQRRRVGRAGQDLPWRRSFSTTNRTAASTVSAKPGSSSA